LSAPNEELLIVVDKHNKIIGSASRAQCHKEGLIHRSVAVAVHNRKGEILLQKRAATKDLYPGKITLSATGHVEAGESYTEAANRELQEELGMTCEVNFKGTIPALSISNDREFVALFSCDANAAPNFNSNEIEEVMYVEPGWLLDPKNLPALAEGLLYLFNNPLTRMAMLRLIGLPEEFA
jgi:16S rRNA (adenine1518-N6/adenine1519-N6)-dimethyltransferase